MRWIYGLLCLFFLILFHEFGHFLAAKLFGVKVEAFSVGFGPVLLHKKVRGTDFRLSALPLGGYCAMKGEKDFQKAIEENLSEIPAEKDSLYGVHPVKRAAIGFAGPLFNFIFAVIACSLINGMGYTYYTYSNRILLPDETAESPAREAGIKSGDTIIQIAGKAVTDFSEIFQEVSVRPDEDVTVTVERDGEVLSFTVHILLNKAEGTGKLGVMADPDNVLEKHTPEYGFFGAIVRGFCDSCGYVALTLKSIRVLFKGVELQSAVSGPARVTDMLGTTIQQGFSAGIRIGLISVLSLMSVISISLFIMNLLPVPVLDGGLILLALAEFCLRRKISPKLQYRIQFIGIAFVAVLFVIGVAGDLTYFLKGRTQ